jgi:tetratricopeptide (TPR) repeat protein
MLKNWLLTILLFCGTVTAASASRSTIDSLENIRKIDSLNKLSGISFKNEKYLQSLDYKYKCYDLARKNGDIKKQASTLAQITNIFTFLGNFDLSRKYLRINEELTNQTSDQYARFYYNFSKANYYYELKKYDSAVLTYFLCLPILSTYPTTMEVATFYKSVGDAFSKKEQYKVALSFYAKSVNEYERINEMPYIAAVYTRIANIHYLLRNFNQNLLFNIKALELRKKNGNVAQLSSSFLNVGEAFWLLGANDSARIYYSKSINYAIKSNEAFYIEVSYRSLKNFAISIPGFSLSKILPILSRSMSNAAR